MIPRMLLLITGFSQRAIVTPGRHAWSASPPAGIGQVELCQMLPHERDEHRVGTRDPAPWPSGVRATHASAS
jgi:hypothetical protein